jgi:hypothetical protein
MAADQLAYSPDPHARAHRRRLLLRAIRLYEITARDLPAAEGLVMGLLESDPADSEAIKILSRLQRAQGKYEELIESLLNRSQEVSAGAERAEILAEIGRVYAKDLDDKAQALVAYVSAFCEDPTKTALARETERLAGNAEEAWAEVLGTCVGALQGQTDPPQARPLGAARALVRGQGRPGRTSRCRCSRRPSPRIPATPTPWRRWRRSTGWRSSGSSSAPCSPRTPTSAPTPPAPATCARRRARSCSRS